MDCWICGDKAETGEHKIKASDLRQQYGPVDQKSPLYLHTANDRNVKVPGIKSDKLKYTSLLCARCNNDLTQPHDLAWATLSAYLYAHPPHAGDVVDLNAVFPGNVAAEMLNVHLYFAKVFGCAVAEGGVRIDLRPLSEAIRRGQPHDNLYLALWANSTKDVGQSDLHAVSTNRRIVYASWFHYFGPAAVNIMFAEPGEKRQGLVHAWHARTGRSQLLVVKDA
jgi:hypothetical protein